MWEIWSCTTLIKEHLVIPHPLAECHTAEVIADRFVLPWCTIPRVWRPIYRVHTDRERAFVSKPIQRWCEQRAVVLTMTAGDDSKANGRIEGELHCSGNTPWCSLSANASASAVVRAKRCGTTLANWPIRTKPCSSLATCHQAGLRVILVEPFSTYARLWCLRRLQTKR